MNWPEFLRGIVTFGYRTGWRISEILTLTWSKVDLEQRFVKLETGETKNGEARIIPESVARFLIWVDIITNMIKMPSPAK